MSESLQIIVIGGGAAGMMAAVTAAGNGAKVTICEQNEKLGKKLFITGKGRCNLTNESDSRNHLSQVVSNSRFLYSAESNFDAAGVCAFFSGLGLKLKTERGNRVFPESDHSSDVIRALEYECRRLGVKIMLNSKVKAILTQHYLPDNLTEQVGDTEKNRNKAVRQTACTGVVLENGTKLQADRIILASGGVSYPLTGADGSGLDMARERGHSVTKLYPALVPLVTEENWVTDLAGLSLRNISITIKDGKKKLYEDFGEMLFTHRGVSGPVILSASSFITKDLEQGKKPDLIIDLKPALSEEVLDKRLLREIEDAKTKQLKNMMASLLPQSLIPVVCERAGVSEQTKCCELSKKHRRALLETLKGLHLTITGTEGFAQAIITQGGVNTKEIDPKTMESKIVKNLYFAGECIDVDAQTGGYNLQIAWSTGYAAGQNAANTIGSN
ncbi:MAG: NAD(P)/FAD-dependent oxidoreductase [Lachnospiraceae bacterium]|nr:NAD(P)/FAD-dependent oxidoreductase [Lachnospiraceae bacterium]